MTSIWASRRGDRFFNQTRPHRETHARTSLDISAGAKRFRATPGRPQELISRQQLYGDRCFGNKSASITEARLSLSLFLSLSLSLPGGLAARAGRSAMGFAYFTTPVHPSLSLPFFLLRCLPACSVSPVEVLLPSCFVSGTIFNSYGAQSKLPMNINAGAKSRQLKNVAH